jgi:hypothetical protein
MGACRLTVSIPEEIAREFARRVPAKERSRYVARALEQSLHGAENSLVRACLLANGDADALAIEQEFDAITDPIAEPWNGSSAR